MSNLNKIKLTGASPRNAGQTRFVDKEFFLENFSKGKESGMVKNEHSGYWLISVKHWKEIK